jgi:RNA 3'-terminal phosphate cyclase (ATP)
MSANLITLDGRQGEGGGQVLRSALSLSLITGRPFVLEHVRARRRPPGLKAQHLTCVTGAAAVGQAVVAGAQLGSSELQFVPGAVSTAPRTFDVGTAGSTALVLQCLFYPLALAGGAHLTLRGGTHVSFSPTFDYLQRVWLPMLRRYGLDAQLTLDLAGFFPQGGGAVRAEIGPLAPADSAALDFAAVPGVERAEVLSTVGGLDLQIATRQNAAASERLARQHVRSEAEVQAPTVKHSRGSASLVWAALPNGLVAGASALGERGVRAEDVGRRAADEFLAFVDSGGSLDEHLGDQVLLPAALAAAGLLGPARQTRFVAAKVTDHLTTHASVIEAFLDVRVEVKGRAVLVRPRPQD